MIQSIYNVEDITELKQLDQETLKNVGKAWLMQDIDDLFVNFWDTDFNTFDYLKRWRSRFNLTAEDLLI